MTRPEQQVDQTSGHPVPGMHPLCQFTMEEEELLLNEDGTLPAKRPRKEKIKKTPLLPPPDPEGLARSRDILSKTVPIMAPKVKPGQRSTCQEFCENLSRDGLRTLVITQKMIPEAEYADFAARL